MSLDLLKLAEKAADNVAAAKKEKPKPKDKAKAKAKPAGGDSKQKLMGKLTDDPMDQSAASNVFKPPVAATAGPGAAPGAPGAPMAPVSGPGNPAMAGAALGLLGLSNLIGKLDPTGQNTAKIMQQDASPMPAPMPAPAPAQAPAPAGPQGPPPATGGSMSIGPK